MNKILLKLTVLVLMGMSWTGCMVSGGLIIHPEPVVIGDPPREGKYEKRGREYKRGHYKIPPGHMPPPGKCRIWYDNRPPGHQPPPVSCHWIRRIPHDAVLVRG